MFVCTICTVVTTTDPLCHLLVVKAFLLSVPVSPLNPPSPRLIFALDLVVHVEWYAALIWSYLPQ